MDNILVTSESLTWAEITLHILLKIPLNKIMGYINTMQIIVLFPLFAV